MGRFYGRKIKNEVINTKTNAPWAITDVPEMWRAATQAWLEDNQ